MDNSIAKRILSLVTAFGVIFSVCISGEILSDAASATSATATDGSYFNDFNAEDLASAFGDNFSFAYDEQNSVGEKLADKTLDELSGYIKLENGAINRVEKEGWNGDNLRAYWQQVYAYYKNQSFNNFTFSVNLKNHGGAFNTIHFSPALNGSIYDSGFSFVVRNNDGKWSMFLGDSAEAKQDLDFFYIKTDSTAAHGEYAVNPDDMHNVKIDFTNGTATAYIDGVKVMEKTGLPKVSYYAAVSLGFGGTSAFDDFSYETTDEITYERIEEVGKYSNNFNAFGLGHALKDDFSFAYDEQNTKSDQLVPKTFDEISGYIKLENGAVNRVEKESWNGDNMRAYWQQVYAYYKNQSFNNFTFSVNLKNHGGAFNTIHFSPALNGSIYDSGFSFVVRNNDGKWSMFLGDSAEAKQDLDFFYIKTDSTAAHGEYAVNPDDMHNVKIDFTNGTATAYIDGVKVMEKTGLPKVSYYAAVSLGFGGTSAFDDFSYETTDEITYERIEEVGKYSNNFNAFGLGHALKDDFSFAYDEQNTKSDQLVPKTFDEISGYIKLENGAVNRVEKESWNGDNMRAYWQQVYAYYKNQSFNNFTFSVNLKTHGSGFNIIHFSPSLNGSIYESGFSFVVKNNDGNTHAMFLGNSEEATQALGGPWVGNNSTAAYAEKGLGAEFYNVKIDFTNGTAKAYINGEKVMEKTGLPKVSYYAAVSLGFGGTSAFDDFSVEETANVEHAAVNNTIAELTVKNVDGVSEVGYDVYYTVNGAEKTDNLSTVYVNSAAAGKIPYIALSEKVYYLDLNTDGAVDSADLAALRKDLLGNANGALSDVNGDKEVNILDLVHIKKVLAADRIETDCDTEKYNYAFSLSDALKSADDGKIILKPYIICDGVRIDGASAEYTHIAE